MKALGRVVNTKTGMIHLATCGLVGYREHMKPLSTVPAPKRNALSKCRVCKP